MNGSKILWKTGWRYLIRHPWQSILMILGITLGVAVVAAVDLANVSASRAFDLSTAAVAGRATHQISGGPQGLDEGVLAQLRRAGFPVDSAPLISLYVRSPQLGDRPFQVLGLDPFAEAPFRDYLGSGPQAQSGAPPGSGGPQTDLTAFLTEPGAVLLSVETAARYGLSACPPPEDAVPGCLLELTFNGRQVPARIVGLAAPADRLTARALEGLILTDIASAQELTGRLGTIDQIDLILPEAGQAELEQQLKAFLPEGANLQTVAARSGAVAEMTAAFRVNLTALSLLALVVGLFLIYNTMTFSVVQRRPLFGTLRCLGVTQREVFVLVMGEAVVVGALGSALGLGLGVLMGQGAVQMVTQTINDLFFVLNVRGVQAPASSLIKGALLGVLATLLTAAPPAWEAASTPPRAALSRSGLEGKARSAVRLASALGVLLSAGGGLLLLVPTRSLVVSFGGTFAVIVGFAMLAPLATRLLMAAAAPLLGRVWGSWGRMAPRNVVNALSRTSIAVAALMVAVSVTIGVSLMVGSFRHTVAAWLDQTLQGDVYISAPSLTAASAGAAVDPDLIPTLSAWPGVARADVLRAVSVDSPAGPVQITAVENPTVGQERVFLRLEGDPAEVWARLQAGAVLVSEPLANRLELPASGAQLTLNTNRGPKTFEVIGVYYDYASPQGSVLMALELYRAWWDDPAISGVALRLAPGVSAAAVTTAIQDALAGSQSLEVRANQALRAEALEVFDRTFAITGALQLLATVVAFIGVLSALLSLELERQRELGILRAIGMTVRQLWGLIMLETGLLGAVAGLLAMPTGFALAVILVYIINRRSFGWTLQMQIVPAPFLEALLVACAAALLAGIYPALRIGRMLTSEALRGE